jgi:hypothetical protein
MRRAGTGPRAKAGNASTTHSTDANHRNESRFLLVQDHCLADESVAEKKNDIEAIPMVMPSRRRSRSAERTAPILFHT